MVRDNASGETKARQINRIPLTFEQLCVKFWIEIFQQRSVHGFKNTGDSQQAGPANKKNGTKAKGSKPQQGEYTPLSHSPRQNIFDHHLFILLLLTLSDRMV